MKTRLLKTGLAAALMLSFGVFGIVVASSRGEDTAPRATAETSSHADELRALVIAESGRGPFVSMAPDGRVLLVYKGFAGVGASNSDSNSIFLTTAPKVGAPFERAVKVAEFKTLIAGMRRGPRVAADGRTIIVTGIEKEGFVIHAVRSEDGGRTWSQPARLNSPQSRLGEGFYDFTASPRGSFHAVWIDERTTGDAHLWHAVSRDQGLTWSEAKVYPTGGGGVCPCCPPFIAADADGALYVLFRNNLEDVLLGNVRDMHVVRSLDDGATWEKASHKLGSGTWQIDGCPVQGGAMAFLPDGNAATVWSRRNEIFLSGISDDEKRLGAGRAPSVATSARGAFTLWDEEAKAGSPGAVVVMSPDGKLTRFADEAPQPTRGGPSANAHAEHASAHAERQRAGGSPMNVRITAAGSPRHGAIAAWETGGGIVAAVLSEAAARAGD